MDTFMQAAIEQARLGLQEGGIPIGSVIVHKQRIIGAGHNRRVQKGSAILHGEMDAFENAGRQPANVYRESVLYTTLSPCCSATINLTGQRQLSWPVDLIGFDTANRRMRGVGQTNHRSTNQVIYDVPKGQHPRGGSR
ncbi:nucleoside deaminase [Eoetvoesiella caeni]